MTIKMAEIEDSEVDEAVSLHNTEYGTKRTPRQWLWEYKSNYPELAVFVVIKNKERIIGTQGMIPIYLDVEGGKYLSGKSENTLVARKYRRRGLHSRLYGFALSKCKDKGMCCVWGYTSVPVALKLLERVGFAVFNNVMCTVILILNVRKFILSTLVSEGNIIRKIANSLLVMPIRLCSCALTHGSKKTSRQFSYEQKLRLASDVEDLYDRLRKRHPGLIHIKQDDQYISWRVYKNPNIRYLTSFVYEHNALRAYCYISLANPERVFLSDLIFEDWEAGDFLLKAVLAMFRKRKIASVSFLGNTTNPLIATVFSSLKKHGFVKIASAPFVLKNLSCKRPISLDIENWCLSGIWTEGYSI